jgi:hypothetical protein
LAEKTAGQGRGCKRCERYARAAVGGRGFPGGPYVEPAWLGRRSYIEEVVAGFNKKFSPSRASNIGGPNAVNGCFLGVEIQICKLDDAGQSLRPRSGLAWALSYRKGRRLSAANYPRLALPNK